MGLFSQREEKDEFETNRTIRKFHLNNLSQDDMETVIQISNDLEGNGLITLGTRLSGKAEDVAKITYLSAIVRQNWIIINQLSRIEKLLKK